MTVVHGVLSLDVGGLERVVLALAAADPGSNVIVCVERMGTLAAEANAAGVMVHCLNKPPGRHPEVIGEARRLLRSLSPDVVHTHQLGALMYLGPAAGECPVIHTEHGNPFARATSRLAKLKTRWLWRRAGRWAEQVCCVSAEIARELRRWRTVPAGKLSVLPNGVDLAQFSAADGRRVRAALGIPPSAPVVGTVGRLNEVKRQVDLLAAFAVIRRTVPDAHLLIVGDGPERDNLTRLATELGVAEVSHFVGYQSDTASHLAAMSVFALTSRSEGFPVSLLEAWATGRPVVCTAVGGVPDVVTHGATGLLVPPMQPAAVAEAILAVLKDPAAAERLGRAGSAAVEQMYSFEHMRAEYRRRYAAGLRRPAGVS